MTPRGSRPARSPSCGSATTCPTGCTAAGRPTRSTDSTEVVRDTRAARQLSRAPRLRVAYLPKHMPKSALERGESSRCRSPDVAPDVGPDTVPMSHLKYTVSGESSRRPGATPGATSGARQASAAIAWARHIRTAAGYGVFEDVLGGARTTSGVVQRISAFGAGSFWRTWRSH